MEQKPLLDQRFELKLSGPENKRLAAMARIDGVSKGALIRYALATLARRKQYEGA